MNDWMNDWMNEWMNVWMNDLFDEVDLCKHENFSDYLCYYIIHIINFWRILYYTPFFYKSLILFWESWLLKKSRKWRWNILRWFLIFRLKRSFISRSSFKMVHFSSSLKITRGWISEWFFRWFLLLAYFQLGDSYKKVSYKKRCIMHY